MTAVARPGGVSPRTAVRAAPVDARDSAVMRLAAFFALAGFAVAHWTGLVQDAPAGRAGLQLLVATVAAGALAALPRLRLGRGPTWLLALAIAVAALAAGLAAAGLEARLLVPWHWAELRDGLDRGLAGVVNADWPYDGRDAWVRLTILLGAPAFLALAAALAFWPATTARRGLRAAALVVLVAMYGVAVATHDPGIQLLRGLVLLVLIAAWLWLPGLTRRDGLPAALLVLGVGLLSIPVAAALNADRPWWNYRSWDWFASGKTVAFRWDHDYGPLAWPRDGTTLLQIKSRRPNYWKAETLDRFDGFAWRRSHDNDSTEPLSEVPARLEPGGPGWRPFEFNRSWNESFRVTVRALTSELVVGAGTTYGVQGAGSVAGTADGTTLKLDEPLKEGDSYTVHAYVPKPTPKQMRAAPAGFPGGVYQYTQVYVPTTNRAATPVTLPFWGGRDSDAAAAGRLRRSPYRRVYELAQRLTAGSPTAYDAVRRVEGYLGRGFRYSERPPRRTYALPAFLFRDRRGYCQQFSGAMALMLRMAGIPSRVATGFSPGSHDPYSGEFRVRDLDAHSWVEVYFNGIGWVTFDPTPAAAPARRTSEAIPSGGLSGGQAAARIGAEARDKIPAAGGGAGSGGGSDGGGFPWPLPALIVAAGAFAALGVLALRRRPRRPDAERPVRELESALRRLGWRLSPGTTLLDLERRLARSAGPGAARYAALLRAHRYESPAPASPGSHERRALRRDLGRAGGARGRLRALAALPPVAFNRF